MGEAQFACTSGRAALLLRKKKITSPTTTPTIIQGHHGIRTVVAPHMFVSVALAVAVMPGEVEDISTITPVSLSQ
jgi:hypothetical protein